MNMRKKLLLSYIVLTLLLLGLTSSAIYYKAQAVYVTSQTKQLLDSGKLLEDILSELPLAESVKVVYDYDKALDVRISLISAEADDYGKVLVDTQYNEDIMGNHRYREEVQKALDGESASSIRHSNTLDVDYLYAAMPAEIAGQKVVLRLAEPMQEVKLLNSQILRVGLFSLLGVALAGIALYSWLLKRLTRPLYEIKEGVMTIAEGDYQVSLPLYQDEEFAQLAQSFNTMVKTQREYIEGLHIKNAEMQAIFDSVGAGLVFLNDDQEIKLHNKLFTTILQLPGEAYVGRKYFEVLHKTELLEQLEAGLKHQQYGTQEIVLHSGENDVLCKATTAPVEEGSSGCCTGLLLVLEDITQLKKLENVRREFVANVSHELKTPLTSIRGFIDTLQDGALEDPAVARRFLGIIDEEAGRLYRMIEQLLYLSRIENTLPVKQPEKIEPQIMAEGLNTRFKRALEQKGLTLKLDIQADGPYSGDKDTLQQVLTNLLDNAVKYSTSGTITLSITAQADQLTCSVKDQGIGIAPEDQERIFERFYRAEKSRSQKSGGTGLGLAIVKHLLENAGGTISVQSQLGLGSTFTITLPVALWPQADT